MKIRRCNRGEQNPKANCHNSTGTIHQVKLFDQNLALTAGAPANRTQMVALDIYNTFYSRSGYEGVGQAKAVIFFIIVAVIALLQLYLTRRKEVES